MDEDESIQSSLTRKNNKFYCGVIEGFYGRPWTTEQRKLLFKRMEAMGMNMYVYAPKYDPKHRKYWREAYSVEEAENLTTLIASAIEHNIIFVYALSPGLDVTFSSSKDVNFLKRKLQQVRDFGCEAFALLFDDIGLDMCKEDSDHFQSFAHAQVSVTNEVYQYLNEPTFLFCPTEYCASRAIPTVSNSEYLKTIGSKLLSNIDIFWTGPKVVSSSINVTSVDELTSLFGRPPLIWDNLHANDYDRKRLFLGPYSGRPSILMPKLKGVLTNPNCEFEANYIDMHTLMQWVNSYSNNTDQRTSMDTFSMQNNPLSSDINLELEDDKSSDTSSANSNPASFDNPAPTFEAPDLYQPRQALNLAIMDWISQVLNVVQVFETPQNLTPIHQEVVTAPMPEDIGASESIDTSDTILPSSKSSDCDIIDMMDSPMTSNTPPPTSSDVSNVSGAAQNTTLSVKQECQDLEMKSREGSSATLADMPTASSSPMNAESCDNAGAADFPSHCDTNPAADHGSNTSKSQDTSMLPVTVDDIKLLVDLFYQPFEHGGTGCHMLQELHWLITTQYVLVESRKRTNKKSAKCDKQINEVQPSGDNKNGDCISKSKEWHKRADLLLCDISSICRMINVICGLSNQAVVYDLFPYLWSMKGILTLVQAYISWLGLYHRYRQSSSNESESWIFRGGLQAEFQHMLLLDNVGDLCNYITPPTPNPLMFKVRPYTARDEGDVYKIYLQNCDIKPKSDDYAELLGEVNVGAYLSLSAEFCFMLEDQDGGSCGYVVAAPQAKEFDQKLQVAWFPFLRQKYQQCEHQDAISGDPCVERAIHSIHCTTSDCECKSSELPQFYTDYPSSIQVGLLPSSYNDPSSAHRLLAVAATVLKSSGSCGICVQFEGKNQELKDTYTSLLGMRHATTFTAANRQIDIAVRFL